MNPIVAVFIVLACALVGGAIFLFVEATKAVKEILGPFDPDLANKIFKDLFPD